MHLQPIDALAGNDRHDRRGGASVTVDRSMPPEMALIHLLARLRLAAPARRQLLIGTILGLTDPTLEGDRPALKAWLSCAQDWVPEAEPDESEAETELGPVELRQRREADQLHVLLGRVSGQARRQRRLLEQELLLRSSLPEDWHFHRAKWRYLELQTEQNGSIFSPAEAARRARAAGIHFHPDQLRPGPAKRWFSIRRALDMLEPRAWLDLLGHISGARPIELALPAGLWMHLRPWISFLVGGAGISFVELYAGSLPDTPPHAAGRRGTLILHCESVPDQRLEEWCRTASSSGWLLVLVRQPHHEPLSWLNRVAAGTLGEDWVRRYLVSGQEPERVLPLRDFVRQMERSYILDVLGLHNGVKSRACERLQISRQTLYTKLASGGEA